MLELRCIKRILRKALKIKKGNTMNIVIGDSIDFTLPQFEGGTFSSHGRYRYGKGGTYTGDKAFSGVVEKDWYDTNFRHWFSIRLGDTGKLKRVQGKNLYGATTRHERGDDHARAAEDKNFRKTLQTGR